jgi:hypothetical protein
MLMNHIPLIFATAAVLAVFASLRKLAADDFPDGASWAREQLDPARLAVLVFERHAEQIAIAPDQATLADGGKSSVRMPAPTFEQLLAQQLRFRQSLPVSP